MPHDELADGLGAVLGEVRGDGGLTVDELRRLSGGASRETWSFRVRHSDGASERLILQRWRAGADGTRATSEAALLRSAAAAGVKVPHVVAASVDPEPLGAPYLVVSFVEGETIARRILRDDTYQAARRVLVGECAGALAMLHSMDPALGVGLDRTDVLTQYRAIVDFYGTELPAFELAFRWLDSNRPPAAEPVIVHGDFRLGNLLVGPQGLTAVLDWELSHLGNPMEDLGWLCTRAWRFGAELPVAGLGTYDELFEAYERAGGRPVDPDVVHWWVVMGTLKWGTICVIQSRSHLDGHSRSVELAAIGRRVCETEHDLLELLR